jgi:hypothetical protein
LVLRFLKIIQKEYKLYIVGGDTIEFAKEILDENP